MSCTGGHHAFITPDWRTVAYAMEGVRFRIEVTEEEKGAWGLAATKWLGLEGRRDR